VVVVQVELGDARAEKLDRSANAGVFGCAFRRLREVQVSHVEADADGVEVPCLEDVEQMVGRGDLVLHVFEQQADAKRRGEGLEVLDGGD
jgi:hypothetical protein